MRTLAWLLGALAVAACSTSDGSSPSARPGAAPESKARPPAVKRVVTLTSTSPEAIAAFEKGRVLTEHLHWIEAEESLRKAVELDPEFALAHAYLASVERVEPRIERARTLAARLPEAERLYVEGILQMRAGQQDAALATLRKVAAAAPDDWHVALEEGNLDLGTGHLDDAIVAFTRARNANPQAAMAWNGLAYAYVRLQKWDDAIASAQQQAKLLPTEPNAHDTLGEIFLQAGRFEDAEPAFARAAELQPTFHLAWSGLAIARAYRGDFAGADEALTRGAAAAAQPQDKAELEIDRAWLELAEGKNAEALAILAALEKDPAYRAMPHALFAALARANMSYVLGRHAEAEKQLAAVLPRIEASTFPEKEMLVGRVHFQRVAIAAGTRNKGAAEQASAAFDAWARATPGDLTRQRMLHTSHGWLALAGGDLKGAIAEFSRCDVEQVPCRYELILAQKKAGDAAGAAASMKELHDHPARSMFSVWVWQRGLKA
jgi:tetratricopeptide (TPR) repeat protein